MQEVGYMLAQLPLRLHGTVKGKSRIPTVADTLEPAPGRGTPTRIYQESPISSVVASEGCPLAKGALVSGREEIP